MFIRAAILALAILGSVSSAMAQFPGSPSGGGAGAPGFVVTPTWRAPSANKTQRTDDRAAADYQP